MAECLFSLVNGDDMFATFAQIQQKSSLVWMFSRLYLYSFISLFIYMILSLFIALITDSYDTIKKYQQSGFPVTDLHEFLKDHSSAGYRKDRTFPFICCCRRQQSDDNLILINWWLHTEIHHSYMQRKHSSMEKDISPNCSGTHHPDLPHEQISLS